MIGTMVSIPLPDSPEPECKGVTTIQRFLWEHHQTEVPIYPWPAHPGRLLRISVQLYNSLDQYQQLAENIATFLRLEKQNVETVPPSDHPLAASPEKEKGHCNKQNGSCDPLVRIDSHKPRGAHRLPLPRRGFHDIRWPSFDILTQLSMNRILYSGGWLEKHPSLLFPTAESENGQYFLSSDWEGNLEMEKQRLAYTLARYPVRGIPLSSHSLIDNLLSSHCVLEGWSSHLCDLLKDQGVSFLKRSVNDIQGSQNLITLPTYATNSQSGTLSSSLWKRALESISRCLREPEKSIKEYILAFLQIHAFLKDPIDGLRRCFNQQCHVFLDLWAQVQKQAARNPCIVPTQETVLAQLAQESSFLAIPKVRKLVYLHFPGHQQLPYAYVTLRKLHRTELSTPRRVLEIAQDMLTIVVERGSCDVAPITVTYRPAVQESGRRIKVIIDGNNRFMALILLQFLSQGKTEGDDDAIQVFFHRHGYSGKWHAELKNVLEALIQDHALLRLVREHSNPLRYFRDVMRVPALMVQEAEFHTVLTTSGGKDLLQPAQQTICAIHSGVTIDAKGQSHGRPHGYHPLPLR